MPTKQLPSHMFWRCVVLLLAAGFIWIAIETLSKNWTSALLGFGMAAYFASFAFNQVALSNPRQDLNWKVIPPTAKILQALAVVCFAISLIFR